LSAHRLHRRYLLHNIAPRIASIGLIPLELVPRGETFLMMEARSPCAPARALICSNVPNAIKVEQMTEQTLDPDHFRWLINARHQVQTLLADLYAFSTEHPELEERKLDRLLYGHLVAIAFSLCRAAFFAEKPRDWPDVFKGLNKALAKLIMDNTFLYPDEKASGSWTVTYYLQNARLRIFYVTEKHAKQLKQDDEYRRLFEAIDEGFDRTTKELWNDLMPMTSQIFNHLKSITAI
jgi:hypothetical protein